MSGPSGAGAPPPLGVVRNSALSFVASAQPIQPPPETLGNQPENGDKEEMIQADRLMPAGLKALCDACSRLYPDQPNPLQVTTRLKYWLGGHDPLDYISMYWNPGKPEEHIPPHWHYISFGLSDLHGDGRVHPPAERAAPAAGPAPPSGCGAELTFRLAAEGPAPLQPPLWPAALLQAAARYVFTTGNKLCAGDHVSWHRALDGSAARARLRHLLVAQDPQLPPTVTPHGSVAFLQLVGCTGRELRAAQRRSGFEVLKLMSEDPECGGAWLVTAMSRRASCRRVGAAGAGAGAGAGGAGAAHLAGVSARVRWQRWPPECEEVPPTGPLPAGVQQQIKETLQRGLSTMAADRQAPEGHMSTDSFEMSSMERALPQLSDSMQDPCRSEDSIEYLDGVHIILNAEGASLLPLAIDGRVLHGSHFTWREGPTAVTILPPTVTGALATPAAPYVAKGSWLQVMIPNELASELSRRVSRLSALATDSESDSEGEAPPRLPLTLACRPHRLALTVTGDLPT